MKQKGLTEREKTCAQRKNIYSRRKIGTHLEIRAHKRKKHMQEENKLTGKKCVHRTQTVRVKEETDSVFITIQLTHFLDH